MRKIRRAYLYLANNDYGRIEAELNTYVSCFVFGRNLKINQVSYLPWDIYGLQLTGKDENTIWDLYHVSKCYDYFPDRTFLIVDRPTWDFFDDPKPNMILMDQPNWPNILNNRLETV